MIGLPPPYDSCSPISISVGMKKLVPSSRSNNIITLATSSAGNASSAITEAVKMPQTDSGSRISVMPRARPCSTVTT